MQTINLNKKVTSIEVQGDKIIINLEQEKYIPKKGEYFYLKAKSGREYIAIKKEGKSVATKYCSYAISRNFLYTDNPLVCDDNEIEEIRPATKYEKALLDNALQKEGKRWYPETMQIEELLMAGDFCIFWDDDKSKAICGVLGGINPSLPFSYRTNYDTYFRNCIPFQSVEHFKGFIKH